MLGGRRGRNLAAAIVLLLLAAILTSFTVLTQETSAAAAPGNPGVPGEPTQLYEEDFENRAPNSNILLTDYVGAGGMTYTGDSLWVNRAACNGQIINQTSPRNAADCAPAAYTTLTALPYALGVHDGSATPAANAAASSYTASVGPDNLVQFRTESLLSLPTANRFVTFSVDAVAQSCSSPNHPELRFYLLNAQGQEIPVSNAAIDPCVDPRATTMTAPAADGSSQAVRVGTFAADSSILLLGNQLGIVMRNENGNGVGNDGAYDNIRVLDVTPQLDKSFSPRSVPIGGVSRLTFTVTNTSELAEKPGWSGTDVLEDGLVVANPANATTTCSNGSVDAVAGGDTIHVGGDLLAGQVSCTFSVDVTSTVPVTGGIPNRFENCASNFPDLVGLNPPACAEVEFTDNAWSCTSYGYLFQSPGDGSHGIFQVDLVSGESTLIGSTTRYVNAVGYNTLDNYMYGWDSERFSLTRIGADGSLTDLGVPGGLPGRAFQVGDFDDAGHLLLQNGGNGSGYWAQIDLAPGSATYGQVLASGTAARPAGIAALPSDWAFVDGAYYGIANTTAGSGTSRLVRFVPETNSYTVVGSVPGTQYNATYGAAYADASGNLYFSNNGTGNIYRVDPDTGASILLSNGPISSGNDGARCATAPIPTVTVMKTVEGRVLPADQFTVGLTRANGAALTSATTTGTNTTASTTDWPVSQGTTYRVTDAMAAGSGSALSAYTATVECTDTVTGETFPVGGTTAQWTFTVPGQSAYLCEVTNEPTTPTFTVSKSASVETAEPGDVVTYEITLTNTGTAPFTADNPASFSDDLSDVLDDATYNGDASDGAVVDGTDLTWSGPLAIGETKTITYSVTVDTPPGGDYTLTNTVVPGDNGECDAEDACGTTTLIGELHDWKTVEASETPVGAGTQLTYTLHFENRGEGSVDVDRVDDLSHVLDDADVTVEPSAGDLTVTRDGARITITGTLDAGAAATVSYTVTLKADGERGDSIAANYLLDPEDTPPTDPVCQPTDAEEPDCTMTPVGQLTTGKSVEASSDPIVAGTTLTYTLTFDNQSEAAVTVDHVDDLSGVLDDAEVTSLPVSSDEALTVSPVVDGSLSISGELAPGQTVTVTYVVTVKEEADRGDDVATNFLVKDGETPPPGCVDGDRNCTSTPLPNVDAAKSVDPETGSSVAAGDVLTYTLTFTNDGNATGAVDYTDYLADILDDASVTDGPTSSDADVTATLDGETIAVTGTIAAGATVTVTYEVTVGADGDRGNNDLGNVLAPGDEEPPTECAEGSALCTENPVGELHDWKTVEASETPVAAGTELTYTLHFENRGEGTAEVSSIDFLTHVLDDADVTAEPTSDTLTVTRNGETITVTGTLGAGESATVVYTVTVKADGERGDDEASNFLVKNDDPSTPPEPPTDPTCEPTDAQEPDCTTTPVGSYTAVKTVTPNETPIGVGTLLAYTLTFTNESEAAVDVDETDTLTGVLDDTTLDEGPTSSSDSLAVSDVTDGAFRITGTLAPGETVTIVYTVSVNPESQRGDNVAANTLLPTDGDPECTPERCTETPLPRIVPGKSVSPTEGSTVREGDVVTYTLTFENTSAVDGSIEYTDDLSGVLDDATVSSPPTSSSPTGSATLDGDVITVIGTVPAGETVTVVYEVTVLPDGQRGDHVMANVLIPEGEEPPVPGDECAEGDPLCTVTYVGELHDWKSVEASETPVAAGTELTYTLHFENRGEGTIDVNSVDFLTHVLDDADVTAEPTSDTLTVSRDGGTITITGSLGAGESATVVYTVTVRPDAERGDDTASNFLVKDDDPSNPPTPPTGPVCQPTDSQEPDCTMTPIGRLDTSKSVSASSDPIEAGTTLEYTLTFDNQSDSAVEVNKVDDLAGVLDDATVTTEPVSSDDAITATRDGSTISVAGTLEPGQTVTVTYVVTVKDEADRGDNVADNFLLNPGEDPPPTGCVEGDPNCTSTPVPNVDSSKSVDPESGSTVLPGDVLTYTLTLTNSGEAAGAVHRVDYLAGVLDDAEWTDGPTVSDPGVTAVLDGTELAIGGTLQPDQTVTVTYTVTVLPDADRGDDTLSNFLFDTDEQPPGPDQECEDGDDCTTNDVPRIVDAKSADPVSGTPIAAGQVVTYTLTFRNDGKAAGQVSKDDVLSGVLDDADLTTAPTASSDALTVSGVVDGRIHVEGSLEPGESATVSYAVTVRPFAQQGDHVLGNWLVLPGDPPGEPGSCEPAAGEDVDCTVHPIGEIAASKSVDAVSGSAVTQGQVLRYTLTFTNTGAGAATVDYTDHLGDVLDDATLTSGPSSDAASVEADLSGNALTIGGSLAAGATATVTYSVTVMAYDRQGNHQLDNFLGLGGGEPQERCVADDPLCTSNPVSPPPPLAITGGEIGMGALALMVLLILGGVLAIETNRRRRLDLDVGSVSDETSMR